ncbi:MAG TPA: NAD(P)/FAD-dependent oxidoreductase [Clostridiales bacterium]|nr:NAD(P)/FAD-dependent oxidoreductase [Clostridiales bacterium]
MSKVIIVGGGPAGLMAAGTAAALGHDVTILERNDRPARKLMITGKGRCNLTNNCKDIQSLVSAVPGNGKFLFSAFSGFMPSDTISFFEQRGVKLKTERGNRVFPVSDRAVEIVDALHSFAVKSGAKLIKGRAKKILTENGRTVGLITYEGEKLECDNLILATGGLSYPATGSTGDGYELAGALGHTVVEPTPSLVPLQAHEWFCPRLQGLSLRNVSIEVFDNEKQKSVYSDFGEMLFTHYGVSGPIILSASAHMRPMKSEKYTVNIDLKPALSKEKLDARLLREFEENINKNFINSLNALLPKKMVPVIVKLSGIPMGLKVNNVTKEQRARLVDLLKGLKITVTDFRPIDEAIITSGGIKTSEIDPKTMQSKLVKGLYFAGELIDVDAYTGGYNLQIAFSTGTLAGRLLN